MTATQDLIWELLACPRDKLKLHRELERLRCEQGHIYPIVDGVPILLLSEVEQTHIEGMRALAIAESGIVSSLPKFNLGANDIDPFVRNVIGATNGSLHQHLVGNLTEYPIPVLRLPAGDLMVAAALQLGVSHDTRADVLQSLRHQAYLSVG